MMRSSFSCVEVACDRITLGASVMVFVSGFDAGETRVSKVYKGRYVRSSLLVSKLVEVDLLASNLAGFGVVVDLSDLFRLLRPFLIERWHDIFGRYDIFLVISLLKRFGCDLDLLSGFLFALRSAAR